MKCEYCGERDTAVASTWQQWQCGGCSSWNDKPKVPACACANCDWRGPLADLKPIQRYWERVDEEDGAEPDGECPECGCLAYAT